MLRNTAGQNVGLFAFDRTTGLPVTGDAANITFYYSPDMGSVNLTANSPTEIDPSTAPGWYQANVTQAETDGFVILFTGLSTTPNVQIVGRAIETSPPAGAVWEELAVAHVTSGSFGEFLDTMSNDLAGFWSAFNGGTTSDAFNGASMSFVQAIDLIIANFGDIPDLLLDRDLSGGADSGSSTVRTVRQALRALRNKVAISAGTLTVYKEDDSTSSWTAAVTSSAGNPITEIDPAGP